MSIAKICAALLVVLASIAIARAFEFGMGNRFGKMGAAGKIVHIAPPVLTNLRITNDGSFRITNTGDNRAVFP